MVTQDHSVQTTSALIVHIWARDHQGATEDTWIEKEFFPEIQRHIVELRLSAANRDQ